jgi:GTPase SAR1 family protein
MAEHVFEFAVAFVGDAKVGKTSLITSKGINSNDQGGIPSDQKYQDLDNYGLVKVHKKNIVSKKGNHCVLNIWDVKGHAEYRSFVARYILAAAVTCLIYDGNSLKQSA